MVSDHFGTDARADGSKQVTAMKPPFVKLAVLVCVHAPDVADALGAQDGAGERYVALGTCGFVSVAGNVLRVSSALTQMCVRCELAVFWTKDEIVRRGVTTGLMLSDAEIRQAAVEGTCVPLVRRSAATYSAADLAAICTRPAEHVTRDASASTPANVRLILVDAGGSARNANLAAASFLSVTRASSDLSSANGGAGPPVGVARGMVGVMFTGGGDWARVIRMAKCPSPGQALVEDGFPMPLQSWQIPGEGSCPTLEPASLHGMISWAGDGLVRNDTRQRICHPEVGPGEGCLLIRQMVGEILSKTGLVGKYGA